MFFSNVRAFFSERKRLADTMRDARALEKRSKTLTLDEALELSDEDLTCSIYLRLDAEDAQALAAMPEPVRLVYTILTYQAEVNNGGLCQYFVNSSRMTAPYLEGALAAVGAKKHQRHFHTFVTENGIDILDLSSFILEDISEFEEQNERFPFDDFDDVFYDLCAEEDLDALCAPYIRANINTFFTKK